MSVAVLLALAKPSGRWPRVELWRSRVRMAPEPDPMSEGEAAAEAEWPSWAERLGGRRVEAVDFETFVTREDER